MKDITDFVHEQHRHVLNDNMEDLLVAKERVYHVKNEQTRLQIHLDESD